MTSGLFGPDADAVITNEDLSFFKGTLSLNNQRQAEKQAVHQYKEIYGATAVRGFGRAKPSGATAVANSYQMKQMDALRKGVRKVVRDYSHMRKGSWMCHICGEINYQNRTECYNCKTTKRVAILPLPNEDELAGDFEIKRAGTTKCCGVYQAMEERDGVKRYVNFGTNVEMVRMSKFHQNTGMSRYWAIQEMGAGQPFYYAGSSEDTPPETGWMISRGHQPAPALAKFDPESSNFMMTKENFKKSQIRVGPQRLNSYHTTSHRPSAVNSWLNLPVKYILKRAGARILHGRYREYGAADSVPKYAFKNAGKEFEICRINSGGDGGKVQRFWVIREAGSDEIMYYSIVDHNEPPVKGWECDKGPRPAPVLKQIIEEEEEMQKSTREPGTIYEGDSMRLQGLLAEEMQKFNNKNCVIKRVLGNGRYDVTIVPTGHVHTVQDFNLEPIIEEGFSVNSVVDVRVEDSGHKNRWLTATIEKVRGDTTVDLKIEESALAVKLGCVGQKCRKEPIANIRIKIRSGDKVEITGGTDDTWVGQRATIDKYLEKKGKWGIRVQSGKRLALHEDNFEVLKGALLYESALPTGWETFYDDVGRTYFVNRALNISQWERPDD